jgi:hypothetical protein
MFLSKPKLKYYTQIIVSSLNKCHHYAYHKSKALRNRGCEPSLTVPPENLVRGIGVDICTFLIISKRNDS